MIRRRLQKRLFVDDFFLYVAVICIGVAGGLLWRFAPRMYSLEAYFATYNYELIFIFYAHIQMKHFGGAYMILSYTTINFVKLSFLFFFRILVRRDHKMMMYWWRVLVIVIATLFFSTMIVVFPLCRVYDTGIHYSTI